MWRVVLSTALFVALLCAYSAIQKLATPRFSFTSRWDDEIPFVPWMIWFYLAFFLYVPLTALVLGRRQLIRAVLASAYSCLIAWTSFLLLPASLVRPPAAGIDTPGLRSIFSFLHQVDMSHNTFPSLHVAVTWICCLSCRRTRILPLMLALAVVISASTLFVKQHTLADVVAGILLALACDRGAHLGKRQAP